MTESDDVAEEANSENENEYKIHVSRVPTTWEAPSVKRVLEEQLGGDSVVTVDLIYPREQEDGTEGKEKEYGGDHDKEKDAKKEHRGFGFVTFQSEEVRDKALELQTIRGGRKATSTKRHTIYLRPYALETEEDARNHCYLWSQHRCPYGDECKFSHSGPGSCVEASADSSTDPKKKKGKCFAYKKGKCQKGDDCPFSHDFEPVVAPQDKQKQPTEKIPQSEKDCINWKSKGKCRKGGACPYRHDPGVQNKALEKKQKKERKGGEDKEKQPLSVRVFGMNYETTENDIREFFQDCGKIQDVTFPIFDDSGRSKGYCGVWFCSPKAVQKAIELDGQELHGRWLRIQAGKMYLKQWEALHNDNHSSSWHEPKRQKVSG